MDLENLRSYVALLKVVVEYLYLTSCYRGPGTLPGIPTHFRPIYLQQELPTSSATVINYILHQLDVASSSASCADVARMREELALLEERLLSDDNEVVAAAAEQICLLEEAIENTEGRKTPDSPNDIDDDTAACYTTADLETLVSPSTP